MSKYIEVTGNINKEEITECLLEHTLKNTFVVIDNKPYPGYHYHKINARMVEKNATIFLVLDKRHTWASIIRATKRVNQFLDAALEASYAELFLFNVPYYSIRLIGLKDLTLLETIQKAYQEEGFVFMKAKRMSKPKVAFFKVKRFFDITEIEEGIYKDNQGRNFIIINQKINWELFRKMTNSVKMNMSNNNFDIVNGAFYMNHTLVDFIRVFDPESDLARLKEIRTEYQKQINTYF